MPRGNDRSVTERRKHKGPSRACRAGPRPGALPGAGQSRPPSESPDTDLKTSARRYTDLQVEASLQLSVYSYATGLLGYADPDDVRLRFDVLTKTRVPELHGYWTTRDRAANVRLFRLVGEVLHAIEAGVFHPNVGWQCKDCAFRSRCWAWG